MQALYQWQIAGQDLGLIDAQFLTDRDMPKADVVYFQELLHHAPGQLDQINAALEPHMNIPLAQIDPVEKAILWVSTYELLFRIDVPYRVVINEGVELAKRFGAEQGHRFVNGVLDKAAQALRKQEISTGSR